MSALESTLKRFNEQFEWHPVIENPSRLATYSSFVVAGMGGSHLGAWLIQKFAPDLDLTIHRNYGLPTIPETKLKNSLFIASSYSGTTEETLDAAKMAIEKGLHVAAVSTGGPLLDLAREHNLPFVTIPDTGLEPRMAIGFAALAMARLMGSAMLEAAIREGGKSINPSEYQAAGTRLGEKLIGKIPVVWASEQNMPLAYIWKIKFNETSKIPAYCHCFPELNHNEFTGFDVVDSTRPVMQQLHVIMLEDPKDHPRVQTRMRITREMLETRGIPVDVVSMKGEHFGKIFSTALHGDWVSLALANHYGVPNPETPLIAEFKKAMSKA